MKYYLKDHVTDEMLVAVGFKKQLGHLLGDSSAKWVSYTRKTENLDVELYIMTDIINYEPYMKYDRLIEDNFGNEIDLEKYIQDLIQLGYVEVRE